MKCSAECMDLWGMRWDWCQKNNKRELTSEEWEAKLARPSSTRWEWWIEKGLKESLGWNIYVFFLLVIVILLLGHAKQRKQSWNVSYSSTIHPLKKKAREKRITCQISKHFTFLSFAFNKLYIMAMSDDSPEMGRPQRLCQILLSNQEK